MIRRVATLVVAVVGIVSTVAAQKPQKLDLSPKAVAATAGNYLAVYEKEMAFVVADEVSRQRVVSAATDRVDTRTTRAEFFLTYLPREGTWISVRDVHEVDGQAVEDPDDVRSLILRAPLSRLARTIAEKNSRFNIGDVKRTFNEPTIGLLVLNTFQQRRFKFERVAATSGATPVVTLKFTERDRPTLISGQSGEPVYMRGDVDIDVLTGRVQRTHVELTLGSVKAALTTAFSPDAKLNLWVPRLMNERYEQTAGALKQSISVETEYTNYQRFDSSVVIKK